MEFLSHAFAAYRIMQDSGLWVFQMYSREATEYLWAWMYEKGWAQ